MRLRVYPPARVLGIVLGGLMIMALAVPASAGTVLYDNGPINGNLNGWVINYGEAVADSFTLAGKSTLTGVNFGVWVYPGDTMSSVDWAILTNPPSWPGTPSPGTTATILSSTYKFTNGSGYNIDWDSVGLPNISLLAGTYYLVLQNAVGSTGDFIAWDINNGPSLAWENILGEVSDNTQDGCPNVTCSDSFQIVGTTTPEPVSMLLFGTFLSLSGGVLARKKRAL